MALLQVLSLSPFTSKKIAVRHFIIETFLLSLYCKTKICTMMTRAEFWEIFHSDASVPTHTSQWLDYLTHLYQVYLESDENHPFRIIPAHEWDQVKADIASLRQLKEGPRKTAQAYEDALEEIIKRMDKRLFDN